MKSIGGYFELELQKYDNFPHYDGVLLNTGRNSFEYILSNLKVKKIKIPYYTCDVILEPIKKLSIQHSFYHIDNRLEINGKINLDDNEYLLITNYFGLKDSYISKLVREYGEKLIIDNSQALYSKYIKGTNAFYSPRKYVGIPDGGVAYISTKAPIGEYKKDVSYERCSHLLKRIDCGATSGYVDFKQNSRNLSNVSIKQMSCLTYSLIRSIDFDKVKNKRIENFSYLDSRLRKFNKFIIPDSDTYACPMVYPFYTYDITLRKRLIDNGIFVATYWPNVLDYCDTDALECNFVNNMIALPIDQRYGVHEMEYIIKNIKF